MIHTLGDSFTKWHWPTWSDWLAKYQETPVTNWAYPGFTNGLIYYQLLSIKNRLDVQDTVYIMWTGSNRVCAWYDQEYVEHHQCKAFFPPTNGQLWFGKRPWQGMYKTHPDHLPSITDMIINNFDIMLKTQWLLNDVGCQYRMMFWQNPWLDTRETFVPVYKGTWDTKVQITQIELDRAREIMQLEPVQALIHNLDWSKFVGAPTMVSDPATYHGLWEFALGKKTYINLNHESDPHPNTLVHHDWASMHLLQGANHHANLAEHLAARARCLQIPPYNFIECVTGSGVQLCDWLHKIS